MACQVKIEGLAATVPFSPAGGPTAISLSGRCSIDCDRVLVRVRITTATSPVLFTASVPADQGATPAGGLPRLFKANFYPAQRLNLACGVPLFVEAWCVSDPACRDAGTFPIVCKPAPGPGTGTGQPGSGPGGGWPWPDLPSTFCRETARTFAILLMAGASALALAVAARNGIAIAAAIALLTLAAAAYALWQQWCAPGECQRLGAFCWAMKRAFIVAVPLPFAFLSPTSALLAIAYGWVAGVTVLRLRALRCAVPSSSWSIGQLFP